MESLSWTHWRLNGQDAAGSNMRREHDDIYNEEASVDDDEDVNMKGDDS